MQSWWCRALREGSEWDRLSEARKRIVESELRDFVLGGVALDVSYTKARMALPLLLHGTILQDADVLYC